MHGGKFTICADDMQLDFIANSYQEKLQYSITTEVGEGKDNDARSLFLEEVVKRDFGLDNATCPSTLQAICRDKREMACVPSPGFADECRHFFAKTYGFLRLDLVLSSSVLDLTEISDVVTAPDHKVDLRPFQPWIIRHEPPARFLRRDATDAKSPFDLV